ALPLCFNSSSRSQMLSRTGPSSNPRHAATRPSAVTPLALASCVRTLLQSAPCRNQAKRRDTVSLGFLCGRKDRLRLDEPVTRRVGLIRSRLGAESAVLRATASFDVYNRAQVNSISFKMFA